MRTNIKWIVLGSVAFLAAFAVSLTGFVPQPSVDVTWTTPTNDAYVPTYASESGPQLLLVYLGGARCGAANDPELPAVVERAKLTLQRQAEAAGATFSTVGVASDWDGKSGLGHLSKFGDFDQVIAGGNVYNLGYQEYVLSKHPGVAATPQLVVLQRVVKTSQEDGTSRYEEEEVLDRIVGVDEIAAWVDRGSPIPTDFVSQVSPTEAE